MDPFIETKNKATNDNYSNIIAKINFLLEFYLEEEFKYILNTPKIDFINYIMSKIRNFMLSECPGFTSGEARIKKIIENSQIKLESLYKNHMDILTSFWEKYQLNMNNKASSNAEQEKLYLKNYVYHCSNLQEYAMHNCEKTKNFGKFITIFDENQNSIKYVICEHCRMVFFPEYFLNYCESCKLNYYSNVSDKKDLFPVTLKILIVSLL